MKQVALLTIIAGLSVVSMATIYASDLGQTPLMLANPSNDEIGMYGHIEFEHLNSAGDIKGYYQTDNFITDMGAACAAAMLFDVDETVSPCDTTGSGVNEFLNIRLGDAAPGSDVTSDTTLDSDMTGYRTDTDAVITSNALAGTATVTVATEDPFTFTTGGTNVTNNVFQAGLFDETSGGNAFAIQNTTAGANPGIDVNDGDQLTVTWTITVG
jgi:hypothetical protein